VPAQVSQRVRRVNESIREVLAESILELKDPRLGFLTITGVRTSPDLRHSEVFYTVLPDDPESRSSTAEGLASAASLLRRELGARLRMRAVPDLHFTHDPVPEKGRRIENLLRAGGQPHADPADPAPPRRLTED
jgi:ribosome-binding factor A